MPAKRTQSQAKKSPSAVAGKRKNLSFSESTLKAASGAIQTTTIDAAVSSARDTAAPAAAASRKQKAGKQKGESSPAAAAAKRRAVADIKGSGIVKAVPAKKRAAAEEDEDHEEVVASLHNGDGDDSSDDEADMLNGVDATSDHDERLSDVADRTSSDDEDDAASVKKKRGNGPVTEPYRAVRLSFLPPEFQEPQLYKFLSQFGATVLNCFCVRSKRTHRSKGVAYVEFDKESVIPLVVEECNGMALGGMSVRARPVTMHRLMPSRKAVTRRRALAYAYRTKGAPLKRHDVRKKSAVALLVKAARTEKVNNAHLKALGVDFHTDFFQSQLKSMPAGLFRRQAKEPKKAASPKVVAVKKAPRPAPKKSTVMK